MRDTGEEKNTIKFRGLRRVCQVKKKGGFQCQKIKKSAHLYESTCITHKTQECAQVFFTKFT